MKRVLLLFALSSPHVFCGSDRQDDSHSQDEKHSKFTTWQRLPIPEVSVDKPEADFNTGKFSCDYLRYCTMDRFKQRNVRSEAYETLSRTAPDKARAYVDAYAEETGMHLVRFDGRTVEGDFLSNKPMMDRLFSEGQAEAERQGKLLLLHIEHLEAIEQDSENGIACHARFNMDNHQDAVQWDGARPMALFASTENDARTFSESWTRRTTHGTINEDDQVISLYMREKIEQQERVAALVNPVIHATNAAILLTAVAVTVYCGARAVRSLYSVGKKKIIQSRMYMAMQRKFHGDASESDTPPKVG